MLSDTTFISPGASLRGVEHCVACGMCLPHCPTYRLTQDETESPRGRIALMRALAQDAMPPESGADMHLRHCLGCRACEKVCPSFVPYGQLLEAAQQLLKSSRSSPNGRPWWWQILLDRFIARPARLRRIAEWLYGYQRSGLQRLLRASGLLRVFGMGNVDALIPQLFPSKPIAEFHPAIQERRGAVALFTGCIASALDNRTQEAAIRLLNALGYDVHVPASQGCCGALHLHEGETEKARSLMQRNIDAFAGNDIPVVTTASGCGAQLFEYNRLVPGETTEAFARRITDISQFLMQADWQNIQLHPLPRRVAVHDPCTLANVLRQELAPYALLEKIPGIQVVVLPENNYCCGGAGAYPLTQPAMAARLRADKVRLLRSAAADVVVTSNIGCALHLGAGLREAGAPVELMHPVVLLEKQLGA